MQVTRALLFEVAQALGHTNPQLLETKRGLCYVTCSCGYRSTNRLTEVDALGAGVHHALTIAQDYVRQAQGRGFDIQKFLDERRQRDSVATGA